MENQNNEVKKGSSKNKAIAVLGGAVLVLVVAVIVLVVMLVKGKNDNSVNENAGVDAEKTIVTVGDEKFSLKDMMHYIYAEEENGALYDQVYQSFYGQSYWDFPDEENDNMTGTEIAKANIMDAITQDALFYQEAIKAGYSLSDEDKKNAQANFDDFVSELSDEQKNTPGMKDELLEYFQRQELINYYKENLLAESDYSDEETTATVSKEKCREYQYEYYCVYKTDDNDNEYSKEEMKKYLDVLENLQKKVTKDNDMESLITDYVEEAMQENFEYSDDYIVEEDGEAYGTYNKVDCDAIIKNMKNGDVSDVIETEFAYFVFRMKDNNSSEYYDEAVNEAINTAKSDIYAAAFSELSSNYNIVVDDKVWNEVTIGSIIFDAGSVDDEEYEDAEEDGGIEGDFEEDSEDSGDMDITFE